MPKNPDCETALTREAFLQLGVIEAVSTLAAVYFSALRKAARPSAQEKVLTRTITLGLTALTCAHWSLLTWFEGKNQQHRQQASSNWKPLEDGSEASTLPALPNQGSAPC